MSTTRPTMRERVTYCNIVVVVVVVVHRFATKRDGTFCSVADRITIVAARKGKTTATKVRKPDKQEYLRSDIQMYDGVN